MFLNSIGKFGLTLIASATLAQAAIAQEPSAPDTEYIDMDLGAREAGRSYTLKLGAENKNCEQLLDFRFSSPTSWVRLPDDPVVRQVPAGQTKFLEAYFDFTNVPPGNHQGFVNVDCENCGFFIFKNCKIDRQQLRFLAQVKAAPGAAAQGAQGPQGVQGAQGPQGPQGAQGPQGPQNNLVLSPLRSSTVDYNDKKIPKRLRRKAKAAHEAWALALKKKNDCDKELTKLQAAADAAQDAADKAKMAADTAEQDARNAKAQREAAQTELKNANNAVRDAQKAVNDAKKDLRQANRNGTGDERTEAKTALTAAEAAKAAADKRLADAFQASTLRSARDIANLEKDAKKKRKAAKAADKAATDALSALARKQAECLKLQQAAADAEAANKKAEADAQPPAPPAPAGPTADDVETQRKKVQKCATELGQLLEAQRLALEAMARLGALGENYESDLKAWADGVDAANDLFDNVPPLIPVVSEMVGTAQTALTFVRGVIGATRGISALGNTHHVPKTGNDVVDPKDTQKWLKDNKLASSDAEAKRVYEQMKKYSSTSPNSTEKMQEELDYKRRQCEAEEDKLDALKKAAGSK